MKKLFIVLLIILINVLVLYGCAAPAPTPKPAPTPAPTPAPAPPKEVKLDVWGGPFGGTVYVTSFAFMDTLNKTHPWLKGSIIETKGSWDNYLNSNKDKSKVPTTLCAGDITTYRDSITGKVIQMKDTAPIPRAARKLIAATTQTAQLMVTFNPNFKIGTDLKGKRIGGWTKGSGAYTFVEQFAETWDMSIDDFRSYDGMEPTAKVDALKDGLLDAVHMSEPYDPDNPNLMTGQLSTLVAAGKPLYHIPVPKERYDKVVAKYATLGRTPYPYAILPKGHFAKDFVEGGTNLTIFLFFVWNEVPENIQYEIAKTLIEQSKDIAAHGGQAALMVPSVIVGSLKLIAGEDEVAPGALKYYKEKGLWDKYK